MLYEWLHLDGKILEGDDFDDHKIMESVRVHERRCASKMLHNHAIL